MAKRKHPTIRSLRQGQTVYVAMLLPFCNYGDKASYTLLKFFVYGSKVAVHYEPGNRLRILTITKLQEVLNRDARNRLTIFYSKKRALSYIKANGQFICEGE